MQSAMVKVPYRKGPSPPNRETASCQKRVISPMSRWTSSLSTGLAKRRANSIGSVALSAANPECIAALIERASARNAEDSGHKQASG